MESENPNVVKTKNERIMGSSNCAVCGSKKLRFIKEQEASGILCNMLETKIPLLCDALISNILS